MNEVIKKDRDLLIEGSRHMGLNLSDQMNDQLMAYLNLVEKMESCVQPNCDSRP